ncbi:hypothetical protein UFOVP375_5 [uncultured Caudovirales phage]|uniref:Large polyvalent protein associated domain-containing protein n=1 Tax=uncultured Caudovirales phage TaxID=2100421 RepID=A0A6J7XNI7_9CAUD|nr:hypothetical protein UFOVP375_5 [uncultured Caudovirales phage]
MALPTDPGEILKSVTDPNGTQASLDLTAAATTPVSPEIPDTQIGVDQTAAPAADASADPAGASEPPGEPAQPVQVAGLRQELRKLKNTVSDAYTGRVDRAQERTQPALKDDPIQFVGDYALIRETTQEERDRLDAVLGGQYKKGINFPKMAEQMGDFDLATYTAKIKDANKALFEEARRGTLNFEALLEKANNKDVDKTVFEWMKRAPGEGASAEDILSGFLATVALRGETEAATKAAFAIVDPAARDAALSRAYQMATMETTLLANISGAASEAGRALYMLSQAKQLAGFDNSARSDQLIKLFGAETTQDIEHLMSAYLTIQDPTKRSAFLKGGIINKSMDVMAEVYINSLLSNPVSHILNVTGNAIFTATRVMETAIAGVIGGARSAVTGNMDRVVVREAYAEAQGIAEGWRDGLVVAADVLRTEKPGDIVSKLELRNNRAIGTTGDVGEIFNEFRNGNYLAGGVNALGVAVRMPGRFLLAEDEFFKAIGYRMGLNREATIASHKVFDEAVALGKTEAEATRLAMLEKDRILTNPPQVVTQRIQDAAKEMTFQKSFEPGSALAGAQNFFAHPIPKLFVPFFRTPMRIGEAVLERSPIPIMPNQYKALMAGGREADVAMAKMTMGAMLMGSVAYATWGEQMDGEVIINGYGPADPNAREAWLRMGHQPYSISVKQDDGGYKSISYNRFDPLSGLIGIAADYAYYANYESGPDILDKLSVAAVGTSIANYTLELPLVQGVADLTAAMRIQNRQDRTEKIAQMFAEKAGAAALSFVPGGGGLGGAMARNQDPIAKNTMLPAKGLFGEDVTELDDMVKGFYTALQKFKAQNPFFNRDLPPRLNEWAEPMVAGYGNAWDFLSPIKIKSADYSMVDKEIVTLGGGFAPTAKKISGVELNGEQYNRLIVLANTIDVSQGEGLLPGAQGYDASQTMLSTLKRMIENTDYQKLPTKEDKQAEIVRVVSMFRKAARIKLMQEDPYLAAKINAQP